jgi:hypothetical protein
MATQQQGQQFDNVQQHQQKRKRPGMRWVIASIILLLIAVGAIIWIVTSQGSITTILPIVIFTVLGVVIGLFQWLFPISSNAPDRPTAIFAPSPLPQVSTATPTLPATPQVIVPILPADRTHPPQSGPLDKPAYRGIMGVPSPTDPRTIQQREKTVKDIYEKLTQPDVAAVVLTGIGGVGKSVLAALVYRYAEEQRRAGNGPFTAEPIWLNIDPAVTFADLAGNLFEVFGKPLPDFTNLSPQHQAMALFNVLNTAGNP